MPRRFRRLDEIEAILNSDLLAVDFEFWHLFLVTVSTQLSTS